MTSSIYLIDADGTNIYLSGAGGSWNGSGTPWTAQSTSPYELSMNEVTGGVWTPTAATPEVILSGGPPFRLGADLLMQGYGPVTEQVGIQARATSHDNAVALLRTLRRALNTTLTARPCILAVQPSGSTNTVYYEILSASVQESPLFLNQEATSGAAGARVARAIITWTRTPFGGRLGAGETLINGVTVNNTGTGTPDNLEALGTSGAGDYAREGGLMNVRVTLQSAVSRELLIGTVQGRTYSTTITTGSSALATSSTTFADAAIYGSVLNLVPLITIPGIKIRVLLRITNASTNMDIQARALATNANAWTSPAVRATNTGASSVLLDMGGFSLPFLYRTFATGTATLSITVARRSTNGSATTGTLGYIELVPYYTWAQVSRFEDTGTALIESFVERSGLPALPIPPRAATLSSTNYTSPERLRGRAPVYISGANLYLAWRAPDSNIHVTSETATLTATHAPLYFAFRGNG